MVRRTQFCIECAFFIGILQTRVFRLMIFSNQPIDNRPSAQSGSPAGRPSPGIDFRGRFSHNLPVIG
jgi:hypothetical protein